MSYKTDENYKKTLNLKNQAKPVAGIKINLKCFNIYSKKISLDQNSKR